jgi:hypothetical protein
MRFMDGATRFVEPTNALYHLDRRRQGFANYNPATGMVKQGLTPAEENLTTSMQDGQAERVVGLQTSCTSFITHQIWRSSIIFGRSTIMI